MSCVPFSLVFNSSWKWHQLKSNINVIAIPGLSGMTKNVSKKLWGKNKYLARNNLGDYFSNMTICMVEHQTTDSLIGHIESMHLLLTFLLNLREHTLYIKYLVYSLISQPVASGKG